MMRLQPVSDRVILSGILRFSAAALILATGAEVLSCGGANARHLISLAISPKDVEAVAPTGAAQFSATGTFDKAPTTENNVAVQWSSSDSSVVTVSGNGLATCVAVGGPVTVTATASAQVGMATVSDSAMLTCLSSNPSSGLGKCVVSAGNTLSGYCVGTRGGICREAYDPTNCPPQTSVSSSQADQCAQSLFTVDATRSCTP